MTKSIKLPYSGAQSGERALSDIQKILRRFGCNKFGSMVDEEAGELILQFEWQKRMVSVKASYRGYAAAWLRENPWSYRRQSTKTEYERKAMELGSVAIYSVLRDWIKGQVTAVEEIKVWMREKGIAQQPVGRLEKPYGEIR